jgi:hypothetical protein
MFRLLLGQLVIMTQLLPGHALLFACHLLLNLFLILFSAFVPHCSTPSHALLTVLADANAPGSQGQYIVGLKAIPDPA